MDDMNRSRRRAALLAPCFALCCCLICGCAAMVPRLEAPQLAVTGIALDGGNMEQQQLRLTLHVTNPNAREITVRGIECTFELEGQPFAHGATDAQFTLPASGETDFALNVTANLNNALAAMLGGFGHHMVDYRLYGVVHLRGQLVRTVPFDQKGRLRL